MKLVRKRDVIMHQNWNFDGKKGNIVFPKGKVVYQTKDICGIVIEPIYKSEDGKYYIQDTVEEFKNIEGEQYIKVDGRRFIEVDGQRFVSVTSGKLLEVPYNPFNGYCYRQPEGALSPEGEMGVCFEKCEASGGYSVFNRFRFRLLDRFF